MKTIYIIFKNKLLLLLNLVNKKNRTCDKFSKADIELVTEALLNSISSENFYDYQVRKEGKNILKYCKVDRSLNE